MTTYTISDPAYLKIFFHAAKHPHKPVNGVLVGSLVGSGVVIEDAIPLLHHWTSLSPMMEIGLDLATLHAESSKLQLVGYYQACERLDDTALAPVGERVAGKIRDGFKEAVAFVIDGENIGSGEAALIPYLPQSTSTSSSWRPHASQLNAFSAGSPFALASNDITNRAVAFVRDEHLHLKFGDFDDHLEDVTIDWLRNKAWDFVHCKYLGDLEILKDHVLVVDDSGFITHLSRADSEASSRILLELGPPTIIPKGSFLLPTFYDLHLHAPQFLYQGTGLHLPLMEWLNEYAFKAEEALDANGALARKVYSRLARRLIENGTGAVLLFGTIKEETNLILADVMQKAGIRAFVGKLSMDISSRPSYIEASTATSLASVRSFVKSCRALVSHLPKHRQLVEPVITPRFVPTCSDNLLTGLGEISAAESLRIQSHLAEAHDQVEWVKKERGVDDIDVFDRSNLLTSRTIQAHCTFLDPPSLSQLHSRGTAIAHCPLSNTYFSAQPFRLREALQQGLHVGLGTDIAGGYSLDLMNCMRHAVIVSRMRDGSATIVEKAHRSNDKAPIGHAAEEKQNSLAIDWKESLYLATRGGAVALGLLPGSGTFVTGAPFDAQCINIFDPESGAGTGALDFFDLEEFGYRRSHVEMTPELLEKWWCLGDNRNRVQMWVQGVQLL